ncbi:hypothetical protein ABNF97_24895 [Plantactinospora sp. B6F1]|uniref:hypothetical protein n=1 Tax=Plantactinospora sp. B6F1 TaxID=3158971 RepID=UPI0032D9AACA
MIVQERRQPRRDRLDERAEWPWPGERSAALVGEGRSVEHGKEDVPGECTAAEQGDPGQQSDGSPAVGRSNRTRHVPDCWDHGHVAQALLG